MTKIVITQPWGERLGGAENMLWGFLRHLDQRRLQPTVVFLQAGRFEREIAELGIRTTVLPAKRLRNIGTGSTVIVGLAGILRSEQPDLLVNWMAKMHLYGAPAAFLAGLGDRVVWWQHVIPRGHWMDHVVNFLPARAVGCSSHACAQAQNRQRPRHRTFVVHPGIGRPSRAADRELVALRRSLGIPDGRSIIGVVGRLQPQKAQHRLLRAVATLRRRGHDVHGLVVGGTAHHLSPDYEPYLRALAVELKITEAVTFTGQVEDATPYLQSMHIVASPSDRDSFGMVLVEAMALRVPVVAFDAAGPAEIIESGRSGMLVPEANQSLLVDALERLLDDHELRQQLAAGGEERFRTSFTIEAMTNRLQDRLEKLSHGVA